jgi:AAA15 family ATPase/GTPase
MLTSIRIQNFRSIRDASVKLGQVNLFIGPNNSGKSNFLKGIEFASSYSFPNKQPDNYLFDSSFNRKSLDNLKNQHYGNNDKDKHLIEFTALFDFPGITINNRILFDRKEGVFSNDDLLINDQDIWNNWPNTDRQNITYKSRSLLRDILAEGIVVYNPEISQIIPGRPIKSVKKLAYNLENIVSFIFNLSQNHKKIFKQLEKSFGECIGSLTDISCPADPTEEGKLKLRFFDQNGIGYWAEEVSEGVLYFLALLCIVYQPNPPKLLLLEEPEKGIHPRRISEVMNFIFELARLRNVQIILTSHSPYVVDHFADKLECISVFDREDDETVIHNAADLIEKINKEYAAQGLPPTSYKDSLGEYWVSGFLGGVPL